MKKLAATLFLTIFAAITVLGQNPTLTISTETPGLPSELFYGNVKVKPVRLRPGTNVVITIADYDFFIQQQYIDFLRRFPEPSCPPGKCGLDFYLPILNGCNPADIECVKFTRGALSANFFRSPEFQVKGSYVMFLYMVSLGQRPLTPAELSDPSKIERPHYAEFNADLQSVSGINDADTEAKKVAFTNAWMLRPEIAAKYPGSMTNTAFVKALESTAGVTVANEGTLIHNLDTSTMTRAQVLRDIAQSSEVNAKFYKPAFVTMEYFGYLRRDPESCHGSADPPNCGYIFHNNRFNSPGVTEDFIENTIVRGFIESPEYFNRF